MSADPIVRFTKMLETYSAVRSELLKEGRKLLQQLEKDEIRPRKKRRLTAAGRAKIRAAVKARWARKKAEQRA